MYGVLQLVHTRTWTPSSPAAPVFVRFCGLDCAKPPPKSDNTLCLVDQGLQFFLLGKGGLAAVKEPAQGIERYSKPLPGM